MNQTSAFILFVPISIVCLLIIDRILECLVLKRFANRKKLRENKMRYCKYSIYLEGNDGGHWFFEYSDDSFESVSKPRIRK